MTDYLHIDRLGARGDGIGRAVDGIGRAVDGRAVFVPFALPGEGVEIEGRADGTARLARVVSASQERAEPFCRYFGDCGGCVAQHMSEPLYASWKRAALETAIRQSGLSAANLEAMIDAGGEGRRRLTFHARHVQGRMQVGFMAARSHRLVPIDSCPVAAPGLKDASAVAVALAETLASRGKPLDIAMTASAAGLDVDLRGSGPVPDRTRQALVEEAGRLDVARLSLHGDTLIERRLPIQRMGPIDVVPPPGGFLQATAAGEEALSRLVLEAVGSMRPVLDLFAGAGPFTLRLAERAEVHAVDGDAKALAALDRAARHATGLRRVTTEMRDLFRRPMLGPETGRFQAVVLDPPRSGAEAQVRQLITGSADTVIMASCDPGTFTRDAAILSGGGFSAERIVPVDQFKWSAHLEVVGVFRRPRTAKRRRR